MLIVLQQSATAKDVEAITRTISKMGFRTVTIPGADRTAIGVIGNQGWVDDSALRNNKAIREIIHVTGPYKRAGRDFHPNDTVVTFPGKVRVGGKFPFLMIAGPGAVESREQILKTAWFLKKAGVSVLRGDAYVPMPDPHSFQGLREEGLDMLDEACSKTGLLAVTEVVNAEHVELVADKVDILQIGARNMQNFDLLTEAGKSGKPVILKRGLSATVEEWLGSAECILLTGNSDVILCEPGIRTFETATRNTADLAVIPLVKKMTHLPIIFDPSHATGRRDLVLPATLAAVVVGAHGAMVEIHPAPELALSDGPQSLPFREFTNLLRQTRSLLAFKQAQLSGS